MLLQELHGSNASLNRPMFGGCFLFEPLLLAAALSPCHIMKLGSQQVREKRTKKCTGKESGIIIDTIDS